MNDLTNILLWGALIGLVFGFAWKQGYLLRFATYVGETREELRKCSWPSIEELKGSTAAVLVVIILLGAFTVGTDQIIQAILQLLL